MCGSMVDIQSATAEIRRGKKKKKEEEITGQKYNGLPCYIGWPKSIAPRRRQITTSAPYH